jgi:hypothetical protein
VAGYLGSLSEPRHEQNLSANLKRTAKSFVPPSGCSKNKKGSTLLFFFPDKSHTAPTGFENQIPDATEAIVCGHITGQAIAMYRAAPKRKPQMI